VSAPQSLTPDLLLHAYRHGIFPMASGRRGRIDWYSPDPRAILPLDAFKASKSLRKRIRQGDYLITRDQAFSQVIRACAQPRPGHPETWINDEIIRAYDHLHTLGYAHSVEAWIEDAQTDDKPRLVGGLYGVALGGAFFGESMFSAATDASKVCLAHLVDHLNERGFTLLDVQITSRHMRQFGVIEIPRDQFMQRLAAALGKSAVW
jgi:leucyl/phenylalanyl-tRNA--protein transferase